MDEDTRRWLVSEVDRLTEIERADMRQIFRRALLILAMLAGAFAVGWHLLSPLAERAWSALFPFGIG
ncbi:MAG TPA: hypothetical protein VG125_28955 [Pirellulales bacterium]|jgi:hypothetical protein|nr:hypothetical protein [Pirellulales bacterium]